MRLYLDACAIIYAIEGEGVIREKVFKRITEARTADNGLFITSRLSVLECRVKPLRDGNDELVRKYDRFLTRDSRSMVEITPAVIDRAAQLRAQYRFKTPDAIHLATALEAGADLFFTGDAKFARFTELRVEVIS